ncbi:multidrug effflux MFS transporter [Oceanobacter sp. 5_MG-2023]|uniref:multidrug effflux MFS transporter n=1 Tax=Oceanobacter sp. 5_MG-2023 TaxID=3062645 RepID=UPI0026E3B146|nr:multidrug effflux MFS transporter [Oceanobacter sp. 5_MG-2023]MDO6681539.1 multidrug effflux MFS transporter [Oceanobacter sp. 5_MG-2023]
MTTAQPRLGQRGMLFMLVILGAFPPLTMDIYLPALPQIAEAFAVSHDAVNLTLGGYMVAYACGMLFWGPLSEKFGRKPILLIGLALYVLASLGCVFSYSIEPLIFSRVLQGLGGGAITVVETAIVKDLYKGRERERILATVMSLVVIAPLVAPVLGAVLLSVASWHAIFVALALFGLFATALVLLFRESLVNRYDGPVVKSWSRLGTVLSNPRFAYLVLLFGMAPMCLMAFIGSAAYVYIDGFGMSEQAFSLIFAMNAVCALIGPMLYLRLSRRMPVQTIVRMGFAVLVMSGVMLVFFGDRSPWLFAACAAVATLAVVGLRVPGTNLILEQQQRDTGSAVALVHFITSMFGAMAVQLVAAHSGNMTSTLGGLFMVVGLLCGVMWLAVQGRPFVMDHLTKYDKAEVM